MARLIFYGADPVAIAADRVYLLSPLDELGLEYPLPTFVAWMATYAHRIDTHEIPGTYDPEAAERYARETLIDEEEMRLLAHLQDTLLAAYFRVPIEQVYFRRIDLDLPVPSRQNDHVDGDQRC